jgi:hypothetical protein
MYTFIAVGDPVSNWAPMTIFIAVFVVTYWLHHEQLSSAS